MMTVKEPKMAEFIEDYLRMGLSRIVITDYEFTESPDGRQDSTSESIVAFDGTRFIEIHSGITRRFSRPGGHDGGVGRPVEISEARYGELAAGKSIVDSPEFLKKRAEQEKAEKQREEAR